MNRAERTHNLDRLHVPVSLTAVLPSREQSREAAARWFAVYTMPRNESAVARHLSLLDVDHFLPVVETFRVWKNRTRAQITLPLFPCYLFARIHWKDRPKVWQTPGVHHIVGNGREPLAVPDAAIEFIRACQLDGRLEPFTDLVLGQKVKIKTGPMQGIEGTLVRRNNRLRFVVSIELINQHAAVEVPEEELEPVSV